MNGTTLYAEVRGVGSPVLLIPGGAEDAEGWRAVAERLDGYTVVTYDRRGTRRSGRDDWPGPGSVQHADDAAGLLRDLGLDGATAFGGSSGGIVAVQLALRHAVTVRRVLVYEPGYLRSVPEGEALRRDAMATLRAHLADHPSDWAGAYGAFAGTAIPAPTPGSRGFLTPPPGREWYGRREEGNAEAFVRDDVAIMTDEILDEAALAASPVEVRFAHGTRSPSVFRTIAEHLDAVRGRTPDVIEGAGHALYLEPDLAASRIARHAGPP